MGDDEEEFRGEATRKFWGMRTSVPGVRDKEAGDFSAFSTFSSYQHSYLFDNFLFLVLIVFLMLAFLYIPYRALYI